MKTAERSENHRKRAEEDLVTLANLPFPPPHRPYTMTRFVRARSMPGDIATHTLSHSIKLTYFDVRRAGLLRLRSEISPLRTHREPAAPRLPALHSTLAALTLSTSASLDRFVCGLIWPESGLTRGTPGVWSQEGCWGIQVRPSARARGERRAGWFREFVLKSFNSLNINV